MVYVSRKMSIYYAKLLPVIMFFLLNASIYESSTRQLDEFLRQYLQQRLTVDKAEVERAKNTVMPLADAIIQKIKEKDPRFDMRLEHRGSVYEKVKIKKADEFDFDLVMLPLTLNKDQENGIEPGVPIEYTTYSLEPSKQYEWENMADPEDKKTLSAERVMATFANLAKKAVNDVNKERKMPFQLKFKTNHPAVTISIFEDGKLLADVDFAPVIEVKKWQTKFTSRWRNLDTDGWPQRRLVNNLVDTASVYLVPKLFKDKANNRRHLYWRYAFNRAEKRLLLDTDPGQTNSCRRNVLRILKGLIADLQLSGLRSYFMKTVLLHESQSHPDRNAWKDSMLGERVLSAIKRLRGFMAMSPPTCQHYFIPEVNIFAKINNQQANQILRRIDKFLENPESALKSILCDYDKNGDKPQSRKLKRSCSFSN